MVSSDASKMGNFTIALICGGRGDCIQDKGPKGLKWHKRLIWKKIRIIFKEINDSQFEKLQLIFSQCFFQLISSRFPFWKD